MPTKTLGDLIRETRLAAKIGLRELAAELEIAPSYLSDIENDRRVPAEEVLRKISVRLSLEYEDLMALAGRFGERAERYLKRNPTVGTLFRRISEQNLSEEQLQKLLAQANEIAKKNEGGQ